MDMKGKCILKDFCCTNTASLGTPLVDMATSSFKSHAVQERKRKKLLMSIQRDEASSFQVFVKRVVVVFPFMDISNTIFS